MFVPLFAAQQGTKHIERGLKGTAELSPFDKVPDLDLYLAPVNAVPLLDELGIARPPLCPEFLLRGA
jgi:hypothetical protein